MGRENSVSELEIPFFLGGFFYRVFSPLDPPKILVGLFVYPEKRNSRKISENHGNEVWTLLTNSKSAQLCFLELAMLQSQMKLTMLVVIQRLQQILKKEASK